MPALYEQVCLVTLPDGRRAAVFDTVVPEDAPHPVREGFARRAIVNRGGTCPCGATWPRPNRAQRRAMKDEGIVRVDVEHRGDCPAGTENLLEAVRAWIP